MALDPAALPPEALVFVGERHLATLTTLRPDGSPHSTAVGFTWDPGTGLVRIISWASSRKARNLARGGRASVCQVDGGRWLTFEGPARVTDDPARQPRDGEPVGRRQQPQPLALTDPELARQRRPGIARQHARPSTRSTAISMATRSWRSPGWR